MLAEKRAKLSLSHIKIRAKIRVSNVVADMLVEIIDYKLNNRAVSKGSAVLGPRRGTHSIPIASLECQEKFGQIALKKLERAERRRGKIERLLVGVLVRNIPARDSRLIDK